MSNNGTWIFIPPEKPKEKFGCGSIILGGIAILVIAIFGSNKSNEDNGLSDSTTVEPSEIIDTPQTTNPIKQSTISNTATNLEKSTEPNLQKETTRLTEKEEIEKDEADIENFEQRQKEDIESKTELTKKEQRKAEKKARQEAKRKKRGE